MYGAKTTAPSDFSYPVLRQCAAFGVARVEFLNQKRHSHAMTQHVDPNAAMQSAPKQASQASLEAATPVPKPPADQPVVVAAFYRFVALADFEAIRVSLQDFCDAHDILGTILLAREGLNGTVSGTHQAISALRGWFENDARFAGLSPKYSFAAAPPFYRMKVRLKQEIVTMGQPDIDPENSVGTYVPPQEWNALISAPDTLVIDTRNRYEVAIGTFENAIDPATASFRDFPAWIGNYMADLPADKRPKNIAMFCTGGIRCEKATSYLRALGYENVFHLEGGILKYLETVPAEDSTWRGECFVFDQRVSVKHGLAPGAYDQCHACRMPLSQEEKLLPSFEHGVSCLHCIDTHDAGDRERFRERQKQMHLSQARGQAHIGKAARR